MSNTSSPTNENVDFLLLQAIQNQVERQKEIAKQRLAEKRRKRDDKEYEGDLASAMIANAQKRSAMMREKTMAMQGAQKDSVCFAC